MSRAAAIDRVGSHTLSDDPAGADLILFVENAHYADDFYYRRLRRNPLVRRFREKAFMYNETDQPWCVLPGLYCSMPQRSFDPSRQRAFCYLYPVNPFIAQCREPGEQDLLFSFLGAGTDAVRELLYQLNDPNGLVENTSHFSAWRELSGGEQERHQRRYASILARSKFVLCPRGTGTSSYRLFEAMELGRAPVLLSDQWVEPSGPDWNSFLLRVPEKDVSQLPGILRRHEPEASQRGAAARLAWEEWFAPEIRFHTGIEHLVSIVDSRRRPERVASNAPSLEYMRVRTRRTLSKTLGRLLRVVRG
jgi:hypothetical protein